MNTFTPTEQRMVAVIDNYWQVNSLSPDMRELQDLTGLCSTSTVSYVLKRLRRKGYLLPMKKGMARAIVPMWVKDAIENRPAK